ncbi:MAG: dual specificity protein phosphatase family protein [Nitrososphaerota archaeon]|nr:dual specificity protein phosphatase family protein [Candidatus Geocrenenecus dongiae]
MSFAGEIYRKMRSIFEDSPQRFGWVDYFVAGSGRPVSYEQVKWVKEKGISTIISLTESPLPEDWVKELEIKYHHYPIKDHSAPDPHLLKEIVEKIIEEIEKGGRVLVHCAAGLGRTGVVLASYLIVKKKIPPEEAIKIVREIRPGSIESHQERSVYEFYELINTS